MNDFYKEVGELYQVEKHEVNIILGDLNAKVDRGEVLCVVVWGLGDRNERGGLLVQFWQENNLVITNTLF